MQDKDKDLIIKNIRLSTKNLHHKLLDIQTILKNLNNCLNYYELDKKDVTSYDISPQEFLKEINILLSELDLIKGYAGKYAELINLDLKNSGYKELIYLGEC